MKTNIKQLRKARGFTQAQLANLIDVSESMVSQYESGKKYPSYETLLKLGEAFDVPISDIVDERKAFDFTLSAIEKEIIQKYRVLDDHGKKLIYLILESESERFTGKAKVEEPEKKTKIIPLFGVSFAAGPGEPDTGAAWEDYEVSEDSKGEFAVRITGDSMEPELHDGEIVLCKKRNPEIGEIAVFLVNGSFYVKQFITDGVNIYLRSLNRKRKDMDLDIWGSGNYMVKCFGTVIHKKIPLVIQ